MLKEQGETDSSSRKGAIDAELKCASTPVNALSADEQLQPLIMTAVVSALESLISFPPLPSWAVFDRLRPPNGCLDFGSRLPLRRLARLSLFNSFEAALFNPFEAAFEAHAA